MLVWRPWHVATAWQSVGHDEPGLQVVVRSPESEDKLTIVLRLNGSQRNLSR